MIGKSLFAMTILTVFFLIFSLTAAAQSPKFSVNSFLLTAVSDATLAPIEESITYLENSSANTPLLREVEFRSETDRFHLDRQRYTLRLSPTGWGESKSGNDVYNLTVQSNLSRKELLLHQALKIRCELLLDLIFTRKFRDLNNQLSILYDDRINVLKNSTNDLSFDAYKLIEAEDNALKLRMENIELDNRQTSIENEICRYLPETIQINLYDFRLIDINLLQGLIEVMNGEGEALANNIHIRSAELRYKLSQAKYNLEVSENRRYISFLEANYEQDKQENLEEALSIGVGFRIPIVNPNRLDINRRKVASIREQANYQQLQQNITYQVTKPLTELERVIKQYNYLKQQRQQSSANASLSLYLKSKGVNPMLLLKLKESLIKNDIALEQIRQRIFATYLQCLDVTGKLSQKPLINYLSKTMEPILP